MAKKAAAQEKAEEKEKTPAPVEEETNEKGAVESSDPVKAETEAAPADIPEAVSTETQPETQRDTPEPARVNVMTFSENGRTVGTLDIIDGRLFFEGNADRSATILFECL
jgi:hypothetical protein